MKNRYKHYNIYMLGKRTCLASTGPPLFLQFLLSCARFTILLPKSLLNPIPS